MRSYSLSLTLHCGSCSLFPSPSLFPALSFPLPFPLLSLLSVSLSSTSRLLLSLFAPCSLSDSGQIRRWNSRRLLQRHIPFEISIKMSKENASNAEVPRNEASTSNSQPAVLLCEQEHHISTAIECGLEFGTYRCFPTHI